MNVNLRFFDVRVLKLEVITIKESINYDGFVIIVNKVFRIFKFKLKFKYVTYC